jgi:hypothetical protein
MSTAEEKAENIFIEFSNTNAELDSQLVYDKYVNTLTGTLGAEEIKVLLADVKSAKGSRRKKAGKPADDDPAEADSIRESVFQAEFLPKFIERCNNLVTFDKLGADPIKDRCHATKEQLEAGERTRILTGSEAGKEMTEELPKSEQYTWDYCMVFDCGEADKKIKVTVPPVDDEDGDDMPKATKVEKEQAEHFLEETARVVEALEAARLRTFLYKSIQMDEIYVLIGADEERLTEEAARLELDLALDPDACIQHGIKMHMPLAKQVAAVNHPHITRAQFAGLFGKFKDFEAEGDERSDLYATHPQGKYHSKTPFREVDRLKLTKSIVEAESVFGGASLAPRKDAKNKTHPLIANFCLHNFERQEELQVELKKLQSATKPPGEMLRNYLGEQVAMYFYFLSFYTKWLVPPAILGLPVLGWQVAEGSVDVVGIVIYGFGILLWSTSYIEAWKRKQAVLAQEWGQTNFLDQEADRPEFEGEWQVSPVTGKLEEFFPLADKIKRIVTSQSVIGTYLIAVGAMIGGSYILREVLVSAFPDLGLYMAAGITFVQIQVSNFIYGIVSVKMNSFENHQTDTAYENSLIGKAFTFKFFNSFQSLFFIAFLKGLAPGQAVGYCRDSFLYVMKRQVAKSCSDQAKLVATTSLTLLGCAETKPDSLSGAFIGNSTQCQLTNPCGTDKTDPFVKSGFCKPATSYPGCELYDGKKASDLQKAFGRACGARAVCDFATLGNTARAFPKVYDDNAFPQGVDVLGNPTHLQYRGDCLFELCFQLGIIFLMGILVGNASEIGVPWVKTQLAGKKQGLSEEEIEKLKADGEEIPTKSPAEQEFELAPYEGTFGDYDELVAQFGFVVLFVPAMVLAPLLALLNNIVEIRLDAHKILEISRRPVPRGAINMGTWGSILEIVSYVSLASNVGLIIFAAPTLTMGWTFEQKLIYFLIFEHVIFGVKGAIAYFIPDIPEETTAKLARQAFITDVLIGR